MSADSVPAFTVIIPTCDRPELLRRCLERLAPGRQMGMRLREIGAETELGEGEREYEVIVTDDGRMEAARILGAEYPAVCFLTGPRRGPAANRNHGAREARGEWLVFTDDDCVPSPGWLGSYAAALTAGCQVYEGKTTCEAGISSPLHDAPINLTGGWLWSCNVMVRRVTFERMGGFDESFPHAHMEDVDFRERCRIIGLRTLFVPEAVVDHPPKLRARGKKAGALQEGEVLYWYKWRKRGSCARGLLWNVLRGRVRSILRAGLGRDSWLAARSMAAELRYISLHLKEWESKYRAKYGPPQR